MENKNLTACDKVVTSVPGRPTLTVRAATELLALNHGGIEMNSIAGKKTGFGRLVRFTGGGALLMALIGLILLSPLAVNGQDGQYGYGKGQGGRRY